MMYYGFCETAWNCVPGRGWDRVWVEELTEAEAAKAKVEAYNSSNTVRVFGPYATDQEAVDAADPGNIYADT